MAHEGGSTTGVVAVLIIFVIVIVLAFFAWRGGLFGGGQRASVSTSPCRSLHSQPAAPRRSP